MSGFRAASAQTAVEFLDRMWKRGLGLGLLPIPTIPTDPQLPGFACGADRIAKGQLDETRFLSSSQFLTASGTNRGEFNTF